MMKSLSFLFSQLLPFISKNPLLSNLFSAIIGTLITTSLLNQCETNKKNNTRFDFDPPNSGTNFISIFQGYGKDQGGGINEINADFSKNDTIYITVFVDYRNAGTEIIKKPRVKLKTLNAEGIENKFIFYGELSSENSNTLVDNAILKNLPPKWALKFIRGHSENGHGINDGCNPKFNYKLNFEEDAISEIFNDGYQFRDELELDGSGWCSQGTISALYEVVKLK